MTHLLGRHDVAHTDPLILLFEKVSEHHLQNRKNIPLCIHDLLRKKENKLILPFEHEERNRAECGKDLIIEIIELLTHHQLIKIILEILRTVRHNQHAVGVCDRLVQKAVFLHQLSKISLIRFNQLVEDKIIVAVDRLRDRIGLNDLKFQCCENLLNFHSHFTRQHFKRAVRCDKQIAIIAVLMGNRENENATVLLTAIVVVIQISANF